MKYCSKCVAPMKSALHLSFDEEGVCSGCKAAEQKKKIDWQQRKDWFKELIDDYISEDNYDCIIPVSGGKDSYFAAHIAKEYGLKALMVTYHSNTFMEEAEYNLSRMKELFGFDHEIYHPDIEVTKKLHRVGFIKTGDMNWHNHSGIFTYPMQVAVKYNVPLVFWGDHGFTEQGGMFSHHDFFEYTAKDRYEHAQHGFDWFDFEGEEDLTKGDLKPYIYPSDEDIMRVGVRGIFLSNYFCYDGNYHAKLAIDKYGWKPAQKPFDRTYRTFSNVDDIFENGVHDYLKFIKLGYGRGTDHACYDIRLGLMTREEGIEVVRKYDHIIPSDLDFWLEYVGMNKEEFFKIADTFRDKRVWRQEAGEWVKDNIWGGSSSY